MSSKRKREFMEKLDSIYKVVLQSSSKGISAYEIAKKLKPDKAQSYRTTVHRYLNTLELMGKVYSEKGLWFPKNAKQTTIRDLPSEIKAEIEKIKEDFINNKVESANRRLILLLTTQIEDLKLPSDLTTEYNSLWKEYHERLQNIDSKIVLIGGELLRKERLRVAQIMIPKFLKFIRKICKKLEEGVLVE